MLYPARRRRSVLCPALLLTLLVACASAPLDEAAALALIDQLKGRRILDGLRGKPPVDKLALASAIAALSRFAAAHKNEISSIDVNPLLALPDRAVALDALIVRR